MGGISWVSLEKILVALMIQVRVVSDSHFLSTMLTYSLLRFLKGLEPTDLATTAYRRLLAAVRRTCQSETNDQFPILFGDDSKSIFGLTSTSISESSEALAHVQLANRGVLTLDRGELDGIVLGDHYQILNNSGRDTGMVVQITKVEPLRAYAGKTASGSIRAVPAPRDPRVWIWGARKWSDWHEGTEKSGQKQGDMAEINDQPYQPRRSGAEGFWK